MSITWQRLAGDTDDFAVKVSLLRDPDDGANASPEWSATWGAFELWVQGRNLCAHTEQGETVQAVHWYLMPLLEWLVANWNPLLHEERLPNQIAATDAMKSLRATALSPATPFAAQGLRGETIWSEWWERHALHAARAGGLLPDVVIRRLGDAVEVSWDSLRAPAAPEGFAFLSPTGVHRVAPDHFATTLHTALVDVLREVSSRHPEIARFAELLGDAQALGNVELTPAREAWLAGLGPRYERMKQRWDEVRDRLRATGEGAVETLLAAVAEPLVVRGAPTAGFLFGALSPNIVEDDVVALTRLVLASHRPGASGTDQLDRVADWQAIAARLDPAHAPWRQGYDLADEAADALGLNAHESPDVDQLLDRLRVERRRVRLHDADVRGLAIVSPDHAPTVASNDTYELNARPEVLRFTLAHELCHVLFDRSATRSLAVASGPWAPLHVEQRANAFAAYLLMPEELVRSEVVRHGAEGFERRDLEALADRMGTSVSATAWHLWNLGLIDRGTADRLLRSVGDVLLS